MSRKGHNYSSNHLQLYFLVAFEGCYLFDFIIATKTPTTVHHGPVVSFGNPVTFIFDRTRSQKLFQIK